jgi:hypothetical protein
VTCALAGAAHATSATSVAAALPRTRSRLVLCRLMDSLTTLLGWLG